MSAFPRKAPSVLIVSMDLKFFDAHTHAQFAAFKDDYREVVKRAVGQGVGMINVGTQKNTSSRAVEIAHEFSAKDGLTPNGGNCVFATVGLHPIHISKSFHDTQELGEPFANSRELANGNNGGFTSCGEEFDYNYYKNLALDEKVVAIGECGLDYYRVENDELRIQKQKEAFIRQIELAYEVKKPLMIHCRSGEPERTSPHIEAGCDAYPDLIYILNTQYKTLNAIPGVVHFFSGTIDEARQLLDMGFYFTFGGTVTFPPKKNGVDYAALVKMMPMERILSETDAPYITPVPYRGKRNEPAYVIEVVKKLAEIKNVPLEVMREQILANAVTIFPRLRFLNCGGRASL